MIPAMNKATQGNEIESGAGNCLRRLLGRGYISSENE